MYEHGSLPRARQDGLLEEAVGDEILLYDRDSHTAHCLSPTAACVWRHCDGRHDLAELAVLAGVSESLVADVLLELHEKHLLDANPVLMRETVPGESRRQAISRVARYGAAAVAGSMVVSATAATPAMASSEEEKHCCQCYKNQNVNELCACRNGFVNNVECNAWCTGTGAENPVGCSNGALVGHKCGLGNKCEE